ncbi:hypothetical protein ACT3CE_13660 [Marinifilum sp. RC60d5]|uniref:hypothetical protein n=1 Tax=Marinifilum sp. RC60d5 TaxID=3458414 RepID=UPI0040365A58
MEQGMLQDWVKDIKKMDKNSYRELKDLTNKYPFFEIAHALLLKNLKDNNSIRFKEELLNSSLQISDRRQLFLLLNDRLNLKVFKQEVTDKETDKEKGLKTSTTNLEGNKESDKDEILEFSEGLEIEDAKEPDYQSLAIDSDEDILELSESDKLENKDSTKEDLLISATEVYHIGYGGNLYTLSDENLIQENKLSDKHSSENISEEVEMTSDNRGDNSTKKKKKSLKSNDLIDNFIQNEPNIQRNVKVVDKQEDISVDSIRENDGFMSETLASIYVKQKLFDKAISVYQKLVLKNPEKNVYFASQIEKIEKLKKQ